MGGFVPDCHTQTFVEVAKLETFMIEIPTAIDLLIAIYFCRSGKPSKYKIPVEEHRKTGHSFSYYRPVTKEIKSLYNRGASCSVYKDGTVKAFSFHYGKGGSPITQDEFNKLDFHAACGGVWKKEINDVAGAFKEVIDLMPTLNPPSSSTSPQNIARISKRDYGFRAN